MNDCSVIFYLADAASADAGVHFYLINQILILSFDYDAKILLRWGFSCTQRTTVAQLKKLVEEKTQILPEHQQLVYIGKYLQDEKTLADYDGLGHESHIFLVMRLPGGSSKTQERRIDSSIPRSQEKCMVTFENTKDNGIVVVKMPCGHPICPDGLMDYAWSEVSNSKKTEIKCFLCGQEWPFGVIKRYGGATSIELEQLELGITCNFFSKSSDINQCPKCQSYCTRVDSSVSSVKCIVALGGFSLTTTSAGTVSMTGKVHRVLQSAAMPTALMQRS